MRRFLERWSKDVVLKRRLPSRFGRRELFVNPGSALRYWRFNLQKTEPALLQVAEKYVRPGNVVWDIGANVGLFSVACAALAGRQGRVLAVEPDLFCAQLIAKTSELESNADLKLDVLPAAVADSLKIENFNVAARGRSASYLAGSLRGTQTGEVLFQKKVLTLTLDWLMDHYDLPDLMKLDVEGSEVKVLKGGTRFFARKRPILFCEVYSENQAEITQFLKEHRYKISDANAKIGRSLGQAPWSTLAIPAY